MKKNNYIIFLLCFTIFISGCASAKRALTGQSNSKGVDEFLIKKKNPLVQPPEFEKLPVPNNDIKNSQKNMEEESDIKKLISQKDSKEKNKVTGSNENNQSLEKSILEKISGK